MNRRLVLRLCVATVTATLFACDSGTKTADAPESLATTRGLPQGESYLDVPGGKVWYKVSGGGTKTPVILLHGGPGFTSVYLKSLEAIADGRKVVRYDQLGSGNSTKITDTAMFNIAHFVAELEALRAHLGYDKIHVLGHSWGTILALEYYRAHPERVASLIQASPALDIPEWEAHARALVKTLPDSSQQIIAKREAEKNYEASDYQAAMLEFYGKYVWLRPVKADLDSMFAGANMGIYIYMYGPSEFTTVGTLKLYDGTPYLKNIKVPTLYLVGEVDEANPATVKRHASMTPGAEYAVIPDAAHMITWDNPAETNRLVREFLDKVEANWP
jgi:proline iminopeptidase